MSELYQRTITTSRADPVFGTGGKFTLNTELTYLFYEIALTRRAVRNHTSRLPHRTDTYVSRDRS